MKAKVYIETSIPSFFYETREEAQFVAMRQWTRDWWENEKGNYQCVTSDAVINELEMGEHPEKKEKLNLLSEIELLDINYSIEEIVEVYLAHYLMPKNDLGDALHLAIASYYKIDFLLTWNCKHLANANKLAHIRRINERLNLFTPALVTPNQLTEE
jgi:predicted nucleic acid-binding protein